jgi:signal recognition particle subunit SRP54
MFGMGGGMPQPTPEQLAALEKQMGGKLPDMPADLTRGIPTVPPAGLPGLGKPGLPGLGGLGGKLPGLGGFNPFGGKKK